MKETDTSDWSLVIHRVSTTSVEIWVGTLFHSLEMPNAARIRVIDEETGATTTRSISKAQWERPFSMLKKRFYAFRKVTGLVESHSHRVVFEWKKENGS